MYAGTYLAKTFGAIALYFVGAATDLPDVCRNSPDKGFFVCDLTLEIARHERDPYPYERLIIHGDRGRVVAHWSSKRIHYWAWHVWPAVTGDPPPNLEGTWPRQTFSVDTKIGEYPVRVTLYSDRLNTSFTLEKIK